MTTIKNLLLTGIAGLLIASCAKDPVQEFTIVDGSVLQTVLVDHAQSLLKIDELKAEIDVLNAQIDADALRILELELDVLNLNYNVVELQAEIDELKAEVARLEELVAAKDAIIADLIVINEELVYNNTLLNELNEALENTVSTQADEIANLNAQITEQDGIIAELTEQITILSGVLNDYQTKETEYITQIETLTEIVNNHVPAVDNTVVTVTDLLTHTFNEDPFYYADTKWVFTSQDTNISGVTFVRYASQSNGYLTVKFRGDDRVGHTAVNVDWTQVREDQATNFKRFSANNVNIDEINEATFVTDYIAEIIVDETATNTSAEDIAKLFTGDEPTSIVVNGVTLTLDADGLFSADGVRIRFVAPNVQNIIVAVITTDTEVIRYNGVKDADADAAYLNAAINFLDVVDFNND